MGINKAGKGGGNWSEDWWVRNCVRAAEIESQICVASDLTILVAKRPIFVLTVAHYHWKLRVVKSF